MYNEVSKSSQIKPVLDNFINPTSLDAVGKDFLAITGIQEKSDINFEIAAHVAEMNRLIGSLKNQDLDQDSNVAGQKSWFHLANSEKQFILDVFCWNKDEFSVEGFADLLPQIVKSIQGNPAAAFTLFNSYEFHLFLKAKYDFYPFDQEEANYPEDDNYFLSKDFSHVIHFQDNERTSADLEEILDLILQVVGSEYFISKLQISAGDSYQMLMEEAYIAKNSRLASSGYPSYEEALEWQVPLLVTRPPERVGLIVNISNEGKQDLLKTNSTHNGKSSQNTSYDLLKTLQAIFEFKKSNLNSDQEITEVLLKDSLQELLYFVRLAKDFMKKEHKVKQLEDYKYLYRLGRTLFNEQKKLVLEIKKSCFNYSFNWSFLGETINNITDDVLLLTRSIWNNHRSIYGIGTVEGFNRADQLLSFIQGNLSFIDSYHKKFQNCFILSKKTLVNFKVEDISFEVLLLTDFLNYTLDSKSSDDLVVTKNNLSRFVQDWKQLDIASKELQMYNFLKKCNLSLDKMQIDTFKLFMSHLISSEIMELDFDSLCNEDYQHVGSVVLV